MPVRSYTQFCGLAKALDVVGERWTLLIVRNLLLGPLRYSDLLRGLPGLTTNLLAKRLRDLTAHGLLEKTRLSPSDRAPAYRLTPLGRGLEPAIHALGAWGGHRLADASPDDERRLEWLLVSLLRRYHGGLDLTAEIIADEVPYRFTLAPDAAEIQRGGATSPSVRLVGTAPDLMRLFALGLPASGLPASIGLDGPLDDARRLIGAFAQRGEAQA